MTLFSLLCVKVWRCTRNACSERTLDSLHRYKGASCAGGGGWGGWEGFIIKSTSEVLHNNKAITSKYKKLHCISDLPTYLISDHVLHESFMAEPMVSG